MSLPFVTRARRADAVRVLCRAVRLARPLLCLASVVAVILAALCTVASAHDRTSSYSTWDIRGRHAHVTVRLSQLDMSRFPWWSTAWQDPNDRALGWYLTSKLQLFAGDTPCEVSDGPRSLSAPPGRVTEEWRLNCPAQGALKIQSGLFLDVAPGHLHFARVTRDGAAALERVLSERAPTWLLPDATTPSHVNDNGGTSLLGYVRLGVDHILSGYDHLAFLLALLLIGGSLSEVAKVVTGFTVAHSITLGITVLGYVRPDPAPVEALIGLSIALVAAENIWLAGARDRIVPALIAGTLALLAIAAARGHGRVPALTLAGLALFCLCYFGLLARVTRASSLRWSIAFIFGLVHGFGFASVLVQTGLPTEQLVGALFGFNVGVELGQLGVVALIWPVLRGLMRRDEVWRSAVLSYGSVAVLTLGVFWFVTRTFG
jgi:HupE / UreJ protein